MKRVLAATLLLLSLAACREEKGDKPLSVPGEKLYALSGRIVSRDAHANSLTVDHKAIPGFMEAMTMEYPVRGVKVETLPPENAQIAAKLHVTDAGYWLTDVKKAP